MLIAPLVADAEVVDPDVRQNLKRCRIRQSVACWGRVFWLAQASRRRRIYISTDTSVVFVAGNLAGE